MLSFLVIVGSDKSVINAIFSVAIQNKIKKLKFFFNFVEKKVKL